jgi:DNA-binding winged helix-turn-helix (wHTH) protein
VSSGPTYTPWPCVGDSAVSRERALVMGPGTPLYAFGPFLLDTRERRLLRDGEVVPLTLKAFDLLQVLVENQGHLLQKEELLRRVWPDAVVEENNLTVTIAAIRKALDEGPTDRQYIETVPRRGYRFIAPVKDASGSHAEVIRLVGRKRALDLLRNGLGRALTGARQCVFVTGEAGIGKSALIARFLQDAAQSGPLAVGEGRALERYGASDAYGPMHRSSRAWANTLPRGCPTFHPWSPTRSGRWAARRCRASRRRGCSARC